MRSPKCHTCWNDFPSLSLLLLNHMFWTMRTPLHTSMILSTATAIRARITWRGPVLPNGARAAEAGGASGRGLVASWAESQRAGPRSANRVTTWLVSVCPYRRHGLGRPTERGLPGGPVCRASVYVLSHREPEGPRVWCQPPTVSVETKTQEKSSPAGSIACDGDNDHVTIKTSRCAASACVCPRSLLGCSLSLRLSWPLVALSALDFWGIVRARREHYACRCDFMKASSMLSIIH
jgi:hypothetical protein